MSAREPFKFKSTPGPLITTQAPSAGSATVPVPQRTTNSPYPASRPGQHGDPEPESLALGFKNIMPLHTEGLLGNVLNRAASQEALSNNPLQLAATINRPFSTAPTQRALSQSRTKQTLDNEVFSGGIATPSPHHPANYKSSVLQMPADGFRVPFSRLRLDSPSGHTPATHISSDSHVAFHLMSKHEVPPVRQQPSPDSSTDSPFANQIQADISLTSSSSCTFQSPTIAPQRIFPKGHDKENLRLHYAQFSGNRKRSREHLDSNDQAKRPRNTHQHDAEPQPATETESHDPFPPAVENSSMSGPWQGVQSSYGSHQCLLSQILECDSDQLVRKELEHFNNRISIWTTASDEDWQEGAEELRQRFNAMLRKTREYMERKRELISKLDGRIDAHQDLLKDREQALMTARENLVKESQNILGGKAHG